MPDSLRYRHRLKYLGIFVLVLSVFSVAQLFYFRHQDVVQRRCINEAFAELNRALVVRSELVDRETTNITRIISDAIAAKTDQDRHKAITRYVQETGRIQKARDDHPVPPFPEGKCN